MKKVIFLDFDGVLTSDANTFRCRLEHKPKNLFGIDWLDPDCRYPPLSRSRCTGVKTYVGAAAYPAYIEDMSSLIRETAPDYWIHGHVHTRSTNGMNVKGTTILSNTLGYVDKSENIGFDRKAILKTQVQAKKRESHEDTIRK